MKNYSTEQPVREDFISYVFKHKDGYYVGLKVFHKVVEYRQVWDGLFSRTYVKGKEQTKNEDVYVLSIEEKSNQRSCCRWLEEEESDESYQSGFSYTRYLDFDRLKKFSNKGSAEAVAKDFLQWAKGRADI